VILTAAELRAAWPELRGTALVGLDLDDGRRDWSAARVDGASFLGCAMPPGLLEQLVRRGAQVFPALDGVPFQPYRAHLYTYDELTAGHEHGAGATLDARIAAWFAQPSTSVAGLLARAVHDAMIEAAVARFVPRRRVVGVMGGHAVARDEERYRQVARLGRALARAGFTVATGGGPGVMEAANLGAWSAPLDDATLDAALARLAIVPSYRDDPDGYVRAALDVRRRWPGGGVSLGVPTWVYADEPTAGFASHIAKYFTNSVREDGLLAIARSGVVYAPGGPGTEQEIFTDTAQNSLTLYGVRSPMVFLGREAFEVERPELVAAARRQATAYGWEDLVTVADGVDEVVRFLRAHDPDAAGAGGIERRRSHQERR
jgi:predicted Rossmann-fold nucleotide-binding protein